MNYSEDSRRLNVLESSMSRRKRLQVIGIILLIAGLLLSIITLLSIEGNSECPFFLAFLVSFSMFAPLTIAGIILIIIQGRNIKLYIIERDMIISRMNKKKYNNEQ